MLDSGDIVSSNVVLVAQLNFNPPTSLITPPCREPDRGESCGLGQQNAWVAADIRGAIRSHRLLLDYLVTCFFRPCSGCA